MAKKKAEPDYPLERVRNMGIIAHIDAGKTTTTEQILFYTGKQHRIGSVDEGNTVTDYLPQEQEKGITIVSAAVTTYWKAGGEEYRINLIDTPGHIDFTAEVERSLRVLDGAVGVFCGVAGVQAQSETVWRQANTYGVPRIAYVNKLDRSGASFYEAVEDIEKRLGGNPLPVQVPIGEEREFRGVVDLITREAWVWDEGDPPPPPRKVELPDEVAEDVSLYRDQLLERLADLDDEIAGMVIEERPLEPEHIRAAIRRLTLARKAYPVLCGASFRHKGVQPLLDAICHYLPAPIDRPPIAGKRPKGKRVRSWDDEEGWLEAERPPRAEAPFSALAFKTVSSPTSEIVYLRVYSGTASGKDQLLNMRKEKRERLSQIFILDANRKIPVDEARVGNIVGVVGLRYTQTGDTLCDPDHPILLGQIAFPLPVISMAVEPRSTAEREKLEQALDHMAKDDPTFTKRLDPDTGQTVISGMGELHLEIIADRIKREWNVEAKVGKPRVSYKQTVRQKASASGVYELQAGEKRLFGRVDLEIEPRPGAPNGVMVGFSVPEAQIPEDFHTAIEEAVRSRATGLGDWGDPLIDVHVRIKGGEYVQGESNEAAYAAAASRALEEAAEKAGLVSLEPVMTLSVDVPEDYVGSVIQDLQGRRAEIVDQKLVKDVRRIVAVVPLAEMFGYATDVRSKSQGRASFTLEPRAYAPVPEGKRPRMF